MANFIARRRWIPHLRAKPRSGHICIRRKNTIWINYKFRANPLASAKHGRGIVPQPFRVETIPSISIWIWMWKISLWLLDEKGNYSNAEGGWGVAPRRVRRWRRISADFFLGVGCFDPCDSVARQGQWLAGFYI